MTDDKPVAFVPKSVQRRLAIQRSPLRHCACGSHVEIRRIGTKCFICCPACDFESGCFPDKDKLTEAWNKGI